LQDSVSDSDVVEGLLNLSSLGDSLQRVEDGLDILRVQVAASQAINVAYDLRPVGEWIERRPDFVEDRATTCTERVAPVQDGNGLAATKRFGQLLGGERPEDPKLEQPGLDTSFS